MVKCPICGSYKYQKRGIKASGGKQYYCTNESHPIDKSRWWTEKENPLISKLFVKESSNTNSPKILLFDIETSHMVVKTFSLYNESIPYSDIIDDWFILSFSAKWLYDDNMIEHYVTKKEAKNRDDSRIVIELWNLLNQADIIIAHNGSQFDVKKANTRFIYHDLYPPFDYREIDTLRMARSYFKFSSNRLDYLGEYLGLGRKIQNEKGLWDRCEAGDEEAIKKMVEYCSQDVRLLENVYFKLRPFAKTHPSLSLYGDADGERCPVCSEKNSIEYHPSKLYDNKYQVGRCRNCNAPVRTKDNTLSKEKRDMEVKRR